MGHREEDVYVNMIDEESPANHYMTHQFVQVSRIVEIVESSSRLSQRLGRITWSEVKVLVR